MNFIKLPQLKKIEYIYKFHNNPSNRAIIMNAEMMEFMVKCN